MSNSLDLLESNRKFLVERGKLNLATFQAQVDAEVDLLKARADFMLKLQEVISQQIKNEKDFVQLSWLYLQAREYRQALVEAKRRLATAQKRQQNVRFALQRAGWLAAGEALEAKLVPIAWGAFFSLISNLPFDGRSNLANISITPEIRLGRNFVRPRYPAQPCEDVPESIQNALELWKWLRARSYVPRTGSAPYTLLEASWKELASHGEASLQVIRGEVAFAEELLTMRREVLWKEGARAVKPKPAAAPAKTSTKLPPPPSLPQEAPSAASSSSSSTKKGTTKKPKETVQRKATGTS